MKHVIVITGATGTGKTTVSTYLKTEYQIPRIITHTTRPMRPGEKNGIDYYFETDASFASNHYLESVTYAGYQYGSSYEGLERAFKKSDLVSIVLDTKGAETYFHELKEQAFILFLTVGKTVMLHERLKDRGDQLEMIRSRIKSKEYSRDLTLPEDLRGIATVIQNDDWQQTQERLDEIVLGLQTSSV
ncbi:guanylate kinase [Secundilactobacillus pentosiphilus]|uniref:Guanylate kinase n=1 Tax=Secundilactobacillus pentosiphilus TaxID=1714682 RepID=A0A1Z5ISY3_9LACO|nr:AAA family ATPase [Secundilactobacillus pentosiphilus]GAX04167.1 guanylate kinase [Secundilactobacillus pentosiphilus]GAX04849.1 guanylate kinase [Secundilactobacillus pentosiphilus]